MPKLKVEDFQMQNEERENFADADVEEFLSYYEDLGVKQCHDHDHVYDIIGGQAAERIPYCLECKGDPFGIHVKRILDIGIGLGYELGRKQQEGLNILRSAAEGGKDERTRDSESPEKD